MPNRANYMTEDWVAEALATLTLAEQGGVHKFLAWMHENYVSDMEVESGVASLHYAVDAALAKGSSDHDSPLFKAVLPFVDHRWGDAEQLIAALGPFLAQAGTSEGQ
jgi:hypothetical protein